MVIWTRVLSESFGLLPVAERLYNGGRHDKTIYNFRPFLPTVEECVKYYGGLIDAGAITTATSGVEGWRSDTQHSYHRPRSIFANDYIVCVVNLSTSQVWQIRGLDTKLIQIPLQDV